MNSKPIAVRLDERTLARLDDVASRLGMNRTAVIKLCVSSFLDSVEKSGYVVLALKGNEASGGMEEGLPRAAEDGPQYRSNGKGQPK